VKLVPCRWSNVFLEKKGGIAIKLKREKLMNFYLVIDYHSTHHRSTHCRNPIYRHFTDSLSAVHLLPIMLVVHQTFASFTALKQGVEEWAISENFSTRMPIKDSKQVDFRCHRYRETNCPFRVYATQQKHGVEILSRSCLDFYMGLDRQRRLGFVARAVLLTLPAYSHFRRTYTLFVDSLFSHALRGLIVLAVSVTPSVVSSRLFSHALCGFVVLTRLAWALCYRGISHARRGLFPALLTCLAWVRCSHTPCVGSLFSQYPSRPAWSLRGSSHMPCVGLLFSGSGGRSAGHRDREVGLWREIIDCVEKESPD